MTPTQSLTPAVASFPKPVLKIARGNDLYFPKGNEKGNYYEPLWIASYGPVHGIHGRTRFIAALRAVREYRTRVVATN